MNSSTLAMLPGWLRSAPFRKGLRSAGLGSLLLFLLGASGQLPNDFRASRASTGARNYSGFDRNDYPGDDQLAALRQSFAYTGYWLNSPPGGSANSWTGKRALLRARGFGFLILFNGRLEAGLKGRDAKALGIADARAAVAAAEKEGFPSGAIIFLDQEEGGRLLPEQRAYLLAWVEGVRNSRYRPGVYCSGIRVPDGAAGISTAEDILNHFNQGKNRQALALWIAQDECPPSPGCSIPREPVSPTRSGTPQTLVWQYAQSPRRPEFTRACAQTYAMDGNCYAPGLPRNARSFLDLDVSASPDPSDGR